MDRHRNGQDWKQLHLGDFGKFLLNTLKSPPLQCCVYRLGFALEAINVNIEEGEGAHFRLCYNICDWDCSLQHRRESLLAGQGILRENIPVVHAILTKKLTPEILVGRKKER